MSGILSELEARPTFVVINHHLNQCSGDITIMSKCILDFLK